MLTKVIMPTNHAEPMDPAMVRKDVSRDDASATFFGSTLLVPQVSSGIIRLPMEMFRITLRTAATHRGVFRDKKTMPALLTIKAAEPIIKIFLIPILSYIRPAKGLTAAVAKDPGKVTSPEMTAEYPITL